ncbi:Membrane protein related to metalloendopeptidase [Candidatus Terasakiella magnetica]|nr:Membrane protein related to metalloendopeptidase [Candidatus Terasakiella magnetica]
MLGRWVLFLALGLAAMPAGAETTLTGRFEQAGLVRGQTSPGTTVLLDSRPVPVDGGGHFLLGFARDAAATSTLTIHNREGAEEVRSLSIARRDWAVQRIEGLPRDKAAPDPAAVARILAEAEMLRTLRAKITTAAMFLDGLIRPADGIVSGVFGSQRVYNGTPGAPHSGLDIAAPSGSPVRAAADGVVVLAAPDLFLTGKTVMIDHGLGLMSSYAHLSRIDVEAGARVGRGETIGAIGATGLATGAHLHWGLSWLDTRLDPEAGLAALGR